MLNNLKSRAAGKQLLLFYVLLLLLASCNNKENATPANSPHPYFAATDTGVQTGGVRMVEVETPKGKFKVWTKRIGHHPTIKVLLLHGGPGCTHEYFESFESFLPQEGIEFIYYDQLGSYYSDQPNDSSLWTLDRFVEEVEQVRIALGLNKDNCYLLGHSWGGILAMQYALKYQANIKGLIVSDMMCSAELYDKYADEVLSKQMDTAVLRELRTIEANKDFANPRYMELLTPHYYEQHICRALPWPEPVVRMFKHLNSVVYSLMQGPSEFGLSGRLEGWDLSKEIQKVKTPTLVIGATHDTMDPEHMKWMSEQFPNGSFLLCPNGSHMCMWDDQQAYFPGLVKWLRAVDEK